jgi:hypothetical protein
VLDDIERRPFLVEPTREHPAPGLVDLLDIDLYECAGQLISFPRRSPVAGTQPDDNVADPRRLTRLELELSRNAVALVE